MGEPARRTPDVAIVIPAYRDGEALEMTLEAIDGLGARERVRVVVVVDGPQPDLATIAGRRADHVVTLAENRGSYAARNAGIDAVRSWPGVSAVLFTDAGCRPVEGWVEAHLECLRAHALSAGEIRLTVAGRVTPAAHLDRLWHLAQERYVTTQSFGATANLAVRADVLDATRFDGSRRSGGDRDFCRRAVAGGHSIAFAAAAVVEHPARSTRRELEQKITRIAQGIAVTAVDDLPPVPGPRSVGEAARLVRRAARAGAVRSFRDVVDVLAIDSFRRRTITAAVQTARAAHRQR